MAVLLQDNFDRANSTTTVGPPQIGPAPTVGQGTLGIISNQLYAPGVVAHLNYDLGTPNVELSATLGALTANQAGQLVIGWTGVNTGPYYMVQALPDRVNIYRNGPGGQMNIVQSGAKSVAANGSVLKVSYRDRVMRVYVDNVLVIKQELDAAITATVHGVRFHSTTVRIDNLLAEDAPVFPDTPSPGAVREDLRQTADGSFVQGGFVYRGRDTKTQDETAGA